MTQKKDTKKRIAPQLTPKQIKYLRGVAHSLSPLVLIGKEGISEELLKAVQIEADRHELVKVKIGTNSSVDKNEATQVLPEATGCALVQLIGKTLILYRPNPKLAKEKRLVLPKAEKRDSSL